MERNGTAAGISGGITIAEFCADRLRKNPDTVRKMWRKIGLENWSEGRAISAEESAAISAAYSGRARGKARGSSINSKKDRSEGISPSSRPAASGTAAEKSAAASWTEMDLINLLDMGLITIGLWRLYQVPGAILAVMVCLFLLKAQEVAKDVRLSEAADRAIEVVTVLCVLSAGLHFITFWNALDVAGRLAHVVSASIPAAVVGYLSYNAIITTRKMRLEYANA